MRQGLIFTFTGSTGAGKDTLISNLLNQDKTLTKAVSATTRTPRMGEQNGVHYHFLTKEDFLARIQADDFVEWSEHHGNYYGLLKEEISRCLNSGKDILSDITWSGAANVQKFLGTQAVPILIMPPSFEALESRMQERFKTSGESPDVRLRLEKIKEDLQHARTPEYIFQNPDMMGSCLKDYTHIVVNDNLEGAVHTLQTIVQFEREKQTYSHLT